MCRAAGCGASSGTTTLQQSRSSERQRKKKGKERKTKEKRSNFSRVEQTESKESMLMHICFHKCNHMRFPLFFPSLSRSFPFFPPFPFFLSFFHSFFVVRRLPKLTGLAVAGAPATGRGANMQSRHGFRPVDVFAGQHRVDARVRAAQLRPLGTNRRLGTRCTLGMRP